MLVYPELHIFTRFIQVSHNTKAISGNTFDVKFIKEARICFEFPIIRAKPEKAQDAREDGNSPLPSLEITQTMFINKKSNFLQCTLS